MNQRAKYGIDFFFGGGGRVTKSWSTDNASEGSDYRCIATRGIDHEANSGCLPNFGIINAWLSYWWLDIFRPIFYGAVFSAHFSEVNGQNYGPIIGALQDYFRFHIYAALCREKGDSRPKLRPNLQVCKGSAFFWGSLPPLSPPAFAHWCERCCGTWCSFPTGTTRSTTGPRYSPTPTALSTLLSTHALVPASDEVGQPDTSLYREFPQVTLEFPGNFMDMGVLL